MNRITWVERMVWIFIVIGSTTIVFELAKQKSTVTADLEECSATLEVLSLSHREAVTLLDRERENLAETLAAWTYAQDRVHTLEALANMRDTEP